MKEEFNLSEYQERDATGFIYPEEKVKEAVRLLKAHFTPQDKLWMDIEMFSPREIIKFIDTEFGDKLTK